jgi:hypothetical protein
MFDLKILSSEAEMLKTLRREKVSPRAAKLSYFIVLASEGD